jgi:hypothetical protein
MEQITRLIEEEVEKRVNERVNKMLERISQTYDISMRQLLRDLSSIDPVIQQRGPVTCLGLTAKNTRCSRSAHHDGYCKIHKNQKPVTRVEPPPQVTVVQTVAHTHTLPPLFMRGCPACERSSSSRLCI